MQHNVILIFCYLSDQKNSFTYIIESKEVNINMNHYKKVKQTAYTLHF